MPTHTTCGFAGSIVTQPIEYDGWSSKIGVQVVPALVVFHTPPEPTATYQVARFSGWMAMSATRPDISAGPIPRSSSPANVVGVMREPSSAASVVAAPAPQGRTTRIIRPVSRARLARGVMRYLDSCGFLAGEEGRDSSPTRAVSAGAEAPGGAAGGVPGAGGERRRAPAAWGAEQLDPASIDDSEAADGGDVFRLIVRRQAGQNLLVLGARQDGGGEILTPAGEEVALPAGWNLVELEWRAGDGEGRLLVAVNQAPLAGLSDLANALAEIERFDWGAVGGAAI